MCSGFTLTKSSLIGLNVVYMLVSLITIGVAVHSKYIVHHLSFIYPQNSHEVPIQLSSQLKHTYKITFYPGKVSGIITSLPIIGGITASGVFLLFVSVLGIIGAMKQHQVMLFIYMIILFFIFIIQFSCSCAALSVSEADQRTIILKVTSLIIKC